MTEQRSREAVLEQLEQQVTHYIQLSGNCAQASFAALQEQFGLDGGPILKALTPFPGIALRCETCGVVSGCMMALGLVFGRDRLDDRPGMQAALIPAMRFCQRFLHDAGSTQCGELLEARFGKRFNLADPAQGAEYRASGALEKCGAIARQGVRIAGEIIMDKA